MSLTLEPLADKRTLTDAHVGSTSGIDFTFLGNNVEVASSLASGDKFRFRTGSSVATTLALVSRT
jgi:hypothetical protein